MSYSSREAVEHAFAEHVNRGKVSTYAKYGIQLVMGERRGARFKDAYSDRWFYNCHCNGGVFNLGHRNPEVAQALIDAVAHCDIGNHHLVSGPRAALAEMLVASTDGLLPGVVFGVGGGEANDLAIKVARAHTGRQEIISANGGYHGHTGLALAAGAAAFRDPFGPNLPGFRQVPFDDLKTLETVVSEDTAAVILEPIPATLGMPMPSPGYLAEVKALCRARGALLILDEVQTGLGRTGTFWAFQRERVKPDLVTVGKGLSGGFFPMSATLMTGDLHRFFDDHGFIHVSTFGGAEVGCAVASKVVEIVSRPGFLDRVNELAARFAVGFETLSFEFRHKGLFSAFKFPIEDAGLMAAKMTFDVGIFTVYAGNDTSALQFLPPMILTDTEADDIIGRICGVFS